MSSNELERSVRQAFLRSMQHVLHGHAVMFKCSGPSSEKWWKLSDALMLQACQNATSTPLKDSSGSWILIPFGKAKVFAITFANNYSLPTPLNNKYSEVVEHEGGPQCGFLPVKYRVAKGLLKQIRDDSGYGPDLLSARVVKASLFIHSFTGAVSAGTFGKNSARATLSSTICNCKPSLGMHDRIHPIHAMIKRGKRLYIDYGTCRTHAFVPSCGWAPCKAPGACPAPMVLATVFEAFPVQPAFSMIVSER